MSSKLSVAFSRRALIVSLVLSIGFAIFGFLLFFDWYSMRSTLTRRIPVSAWRVFGLANGLMWTGWAVLLLRRLVAGDPAVEFTDARLVSRAVGREQSAEWGEITEVVVGRRGTISVLLEKGSKITIPSLLLDPGGTEAVLGRLVSRLESGDG